MLEYLMSFKEKYDGAVKGQAYTDGQKQRWGSQKKNATSPIVALELILITSEIGAHKRRDVAMVNIIG